MFYFVFKTGGAYAGLVCNKDRIAALMLPDKKQAVLKAVKNKYPQAVQKKNLFMVKTAGLISRYFDGEKVSFAGIKTDLCSLKPFTKRVLARTSVIPYGVTKTYSWAGSGSARAAGNALGKNPVPLIIPCHRVIKADGGIGGFAFGLSWKKRLLDIEKSYKK